MVETNFGGQYLNADTAADGDTIEFIGEGSYVDLESRGQTKQVLNIPVKVNDKKELLYTPSQKAGQLFSKSWGKNTSTWVGHKFKVKLVIIEVAGKEMSVIRPQII